MVLYACAFMLIAVLPLFLAVDPETRAEFEKQSRNSPLSGASRNSAGGAGGPANFDLAGWMAGTSPGPMAAAESDAARISTGRENVNSARRRG